MVDDDALGVVARPDDLDGLDGVVGGEVGEEAGEDTQADTTSTGERSMIDLGR